MDHQKIYDQIIDRSKFRGLSKKKSLEFERHHIIPKSLGGSSLKENLVDLTPREHFICHWLLAKIHGDKMIKAFWFMCQNTMKTKHCPNSKQYEIARKMFVDQTMIGNVYAKGHKHTDEHRLNIKKGMQKFFDSLTEKERLVHYEHNKGKLKGRKLTEEQKQHLYGNKYGVGSRSEEFKKKLQGNSNAKGYRHSEEDKLKFSENNSGEKNPFFGKKHTEETKQRLRGPRDKLRKHWAKWRRDHNRKPFPDDWKYL